jgi:hypothetical protein
MRLPFPLRTLAPTLAAAAAVVGALALSSCEPEGSAGGPPEAQAHVPVHVDSTFPIEEEIRRFTVGMTPTGELSGGASSRDALVDALLRRLEAGDTAGVAGLALTRTEFAFLYYPHTIYTAPPYELSPALVWFQLQNRSSRGLTRLLRRYAGKTLHDTGHACPDAGEPWGPGHIWHGCTVLGLVTEEVAEPGAPVGAVEERLFGSILRVGDRYKFVSFSNEL